MDDWRRSPGRGKYARVERERRFLLVGDATAAGEPREIEDRYLDGTTLRLRRLTVGGESVFKLTQKVRWHDGLLEVATTNTYLTAEEHARLAVLPAALLTKTRRLWTFEGRTFAADELHGPLAGLALAEIEVGSLDEVLPSPPWLGDEVTYDGRYSGASLARHGLPS